MEEFCERRAEQICGFATGCCAIAFDVQCLETAARGCQKTVEESLGAHAEFDVEQAEACLTAEKEAWYSVSCEIQPVSANASVDALTICAHLGRGTLELGAPCDRDVDCARSENGAAVCALPGTDAAACTEAAIVDTGEDCSADNAVCGAEDYCDVESNTCAPLRKEDESCSHHSECLVGFCDPGLKVCPALTRETLCASLEATL